MSSAANWSTIESQEISAGKGKEGPPISIRISNGWYRVDVVGRITAVMRTVCVVDDDPLVRKTLELMLSEAGYEVVSHDSGQQFLSAVDADASQSPLACVLLDVNMPGMDGLAVLKELSERKISVPIVMISGQGDIATAVEAMRSGAGDFIEKPFKPDDLESAVERAAASMPDRRQPPPTLANLSSREIEVLELLVAGDANKVIAYKLGISQRTVEVHRARIMERVGVKTFAELIRKAIAAGF